MEGALALQQLVVQTPPLELVRGGVSGELRALAQRLGVPAAATSEGPILFESILDRLLAAGLSCWIVDWVTSVVADAGAASDDPEATRLLSGEAVAVWCGRATERLAAELEGLVSGEAAGARDEAAELARIGAAAEALLQVTRALSAPAVAASAAPRAVERRLRLLAGAATALGYCLAAGVALQAASLSFASRATWSRAISARRGAAPSGRLFLDDTIDALRMYQPLGGGSPAKTPRGSARGTVAAAGYPWATPAAAVGALFLGASDPGWGAEATTAGGFAASEEARRVRLALFRYFLVDGGWAPTAGAAGQVGESPLTAALAAQLSHTGFARAFDLPSGLVAQTEACALLDQAAGGAEAGVSGSAAALDAACALLLASANAATPFRVVEALASAGRPAQALAVQRARGAAAAGGALQEAGALLAARLELGLLQEAHTGVAQHCAQLRSAQERPTHLSALMGQLLDWAGARDDARRQPEATRGGDAAAAPLSWLQRVAELPLGAEEERVVAAWLEARAARGEADGDLLPLLLLQRGRSLEALAAYARWRDSAAAAAAPTNAAAAARPTQLRALMAATAAALPPVLRGAALASDGGSSAAARRLTAGLGAQLDGVQPALLAPRGAEPPAFLAPVVLPCGAGPAAAADGSAGGNAGAGEEVPPVSAAASLAALPGDSASAMAVDALDSVAPATDAVISGGLLFGVPTPAGSLFGAPAAAAAAAAPAPVADGVERGGGSGGGAGAGSGVIGADEFMTQLLGLPAAAGPSGGGGVKTRSSARSSKRQRH